MFMLTDRRVLASLRASKDNSAVEVSFGEMQNLSEGYLCLPFATYFKNVIFKDEIHLQFKL